MDGIGLIFLGMYILGRGVVTYAFHFMAHFRSKVMDEYMKFVCRGTSVETWPCTSQFLKLGPEILTRDLDQAHQNSAQKKKKKLPTYGLLNVFHDHEMDEKSTDFHFVL